jgi:hypothetical protein
VRDEFPHAAASDDAQPPALDVYRRALAAAPDSSVVILSIGVLVNLRELLESKPDSFSPLAGADLVRRKVRQLVLMGGQFPQSDPARGEYNLSFGNGGPDAHYTVEHWPTPILFSGFEIGLEIVTGKQLLAAPPSNPVRRAYELFTSFNGRPSWDLTAVLAAVEDPALYWDVSPEGYCQVTPIGTNRWHSTPNRAHSYLIAKVPPAEIAKALDHLLAQPPTA